MPTRSDDINLNTMTGASNKPFDYLACGLALVVSDLPDWRLMFVDPGYAVCCNPDEPSSIEHAVHALVDRPGKMRAMGELGRQRILCDWNYETQFAPILGVITKRPSR
jgi:glycosyltransferase involved in cell wall biosynthesis